MKLNYCSFIALLLMIQAITSFRGNAFQPAFQDSIKRKEPFKNLGSQVAERWLEGTVFTVDSIGNEWVYTVLRGKPGYLLGYNISSKKIMVNLPLERMDGSWDITVSSDGWLYVAGSAG